MTKAMPYFTRAETPDGAVSCNYHSNLVAAKEYARSLSTLALDDGELMYAAVDVMHEADPCDAIVSYTNGRA